MNEDTKPQGRSRLAGTEWEAKWTLKLVQGDAATPTIERPVNPNLVNYSLKIGSTVHRNFYKWFFIQPTSLSKTTKLDPVKNTL